MTNQILKTPEEPKQFVPGPAIRPTGPLLRWLNETVPPASGPPTRVRLPVIIPWSQDDLSIEEAFIGTGGRVDAETMFLRLDDSMMGISLLERVHERCSKPGTVCAVWLEGYWGSRLPGESNKSKYGMIPRMDLDPRQSDTTRWLFRVIRVHDTLGGGNPAALRFMRRVNPPLPECKPRLRIRDRDDGQSSTVHRDQRHRSNVLSVTTMRPNDPDCPTRIYRSLDRSCFPPAWSLHQSTSLIRRLRLDVCSLVNRSCLMAMIASPRANSSPDLCGVSPS